LFAAASSAFVTISTVDDAAAPGLVRIDGKRIGLPRSKKKINVAELAEYHF